MRKEAFGFIQVRRTMPSEEEGQRRGEVNWERMCFD